MKSGEFSGHSIDEAVFHGLMELGLSIDEVSIETLQNESKGLFGIGAKMARVRLVQRDPSEAEAAFYNQPVRREDSPRREGAPRRDDGPRRDSAPRRDDGPRHDGAPRRDNGLRRDSAPRDRGPRPSAEEAVPQQVYDYSAELAAKLPAAQFLAGLLEKMHIDANVLAAETEDGMRLCINSDTKGLLIGRRGETLDAMQYLTSLHANRGCKQDKYLRVTLDTEDYRSKREYTLQRLARRQAARVKSTGRPVSMEPMNPYERRVLHASLQNNPYVTTHSEGEEPNRRVVITPKR